ncbi:MAG: nitronate monooxygenase [Deltaproteobacteria bacterium]|nr:nitronate monooxygenase [Deltaproteobacteria bacterium]
MGRPVLRTRLCDELGIEYPILSAGMGPNLISEPVGAPVDLVVAVSEAGGLGVLGGSGYSLRELRDAIAEIKARTNKPFGVDLLLPKNLMQGQGLSGEEDIPLAEVLKLLPEEHQAWFNKIRAELDLPELDPNLTVKTDSTTMRPKEAVAICIEEGVPLFCAGLGDPAWMVEDAHAAGIKVLGITGNAKNAKRIAAGGADYVVAQGHEGGGHTGRVGTMALIPQAIDAAAPTPVLGAGGIGDGRGVAACLAMGCAGVWVGTRFLATIEGGASDICKRRILESTDEDTRVSRLYTGKTSRANVSRFHELWDASGLEALPFPLQVLLSSALLDCFVRGGKEEYVGGFAGQISGLIHDIKPAGEVLMDMVTQTVDILKNRLPRDVEVSEG